MFEVNYIGGPKDGQKEAMQSYHEMIEVAVAPPIKTTDRLENVQNIRIYFYRHKTGTKDWILV